MNSPTTPRGVALRRFLRHYVEMIIAMVGGMTVLGAAESALLNPVGWAEVRAVPELGALIMATNMTVPMVGWMWHRGHSPVALGQMAAAMYAPFVACLPLVWFGLLSATGLMIAGHAVMVPAMTVAMLWRRDEYTGRVHERAHAPLGRTLGLEKDYQVETTSSPSGVTHVTLTRTGSLNGPS